MFGFRSRAKKSEIVAAAAPAVADESRQTSFRAGDHVRTMADLDGFPAGCPGEVTSIQDYEGKRSYYVMLDIGFGIRATAKDVRLIAPYDPTVLTVGTRVRLTQDFTGFLWEKNIATESQDVKGDPVSYPAGTTGTINMQPPAGADEYMVSPDYEGPMCLAVRASKLERILGRTRVTTDSEGGIHIKQLFNCMDTVMLRIDLAGEDGSVYKAGWKGYVRPIDPAMSLLEGVEESWRTGIYTLHLSDHPSGRANNIIHVRASALKLDSDFRPSPYSSIPRKDKATEADPESVASGRPSFGEKQQEAADGVPGDVDISGARDMWAFVVAVGEDDEDAADAILARGDHAQMLARATSHIMAKLREEGMDLVIYGRGAIAAIAEKEANGGYPGAVDTSGAQRLWAFVVAAGEDDEEAGSAILAAGDHVQMLVWATSHIMVKLRQQGTDPVAYGRSMIEVITEKEAKG